MYHLHIILKTSFLSGILFGLFYAAVGVLFFWLNLAILSGPPSEQLMSYFSSEVLAMIPIKIMIGIINGFLFGILFMIFYKIIPGSMSIINGICISLFLWLLFPVLSYLYLNQGFFLTWILTYEVNVIFDSVIYILFGCFFLYLYEKLDHYDSAIT